MNAPPKKNQRRSTGPEPLEDLLRRPAKDVGIVEPLGEQRERRVEPDGRRDQNDPGCDLDAHALMRP
jgi:hypothetical protein